MSSVVLVGLCMRLCACVLRDSDTLAVSEAVVFEAGFAGAEGIGAVGRTVNLFCLSTQRRVSLAVVQLVLCEHTYTPDVRTIHQSTSHANLYTWSGNGRVSLRETPHLSCSRSRRSRSPRSR